MTKPKKHVRRKLTQEKVDAINRRNGVYVTEPHEGIVGDIERPRDVVVRDESKRGRIEKR